MSSFHASVISTNQDGVHPDLSVLLKRHQQHDFKRPIASHTITAFQSAIAWLESWDGAVIIDACCGVGESTVNLAKANRHAKVIGIDKSISRLNKHDAYAKGTLDIDSNYLMLQADLNDFWRLIASYVKTENSAWHIQKQFVLYPNPYPKKSQLGKRWHASPIFKDLLSVCMHHEVRSNWLVYLEEFLIAAEFYGMQGSISEIPLGEDAFTPFERKYKQSGQTCFKLLILPCGSDK